MRLNGPARKGPGLLSACAWAGLGVLAVMGAFGVAATDEGMERLAQLSTPAANRPAVKEARADSPQMLSLQKSVARLQSELRRAALEKTAMAHRLASVEEQLTPTTTGSIGPQPRRAADAGGTAVTFSQADRAAGAPKPVRVIHGDLPAGREGEAPILTLGEVRDRLPRLSPTDPSVLMRTSFAIEIGHAGSMRELRERWSRLTEQHKPALAGFDPLVAVRETDDGALVLRLLAGPMTNAADAIRLCMSIREVGTDCTPVSYEGQRLALR